ncbi:MAG: peptidase M14 [Clostridia bacterium]|nr:peptidase M14 [Clostridia bacterium]
MERTSSFDKNIMTYDRALDHALMMEYINELSERYPFLGVTSLGTSIFERSIPVLSIGEGERALLYVGAHHGMEWISSILLLRFVNELCEMIKGKSRIFSYDPKYLLATRTIYIIPMLNPDGVEYQINGVSKDNPLYERLLKMNGKSTDFSHWQANGRGVDLNHNYDCGFSEYKRIEEGLGIFDGAPTRFSGSMPESEPEVASLCNFLRFNDNIEMILTLHTQGEEIYYTGGGEVLPRSRAVASALARLSGYKLSVPEGPAAYGGLTDWAITKLKRLCFTVECGRGENPLPLSDYFSIYSEIRKMLFCAPMFL